MHEKNFKQVQIETDKILKETQNLLEELSIKEKESHSDDEVKTLSLSNLTKHQETLKNEAQKLKNLEYVVAVVGTMKAGKSMTINAIVGQEILPSREFPMTTLPTLITHVPKQTEPRLIIKKINPFNELKNAIKEKISTKQTFELDDIQNLVLRIKENKIEFKTEYKGQEKISHFLRDINDLMRIAKEFDIEPPYEEYTDVDDLPRIEVEFYHLSKYTQEASEARLTLLDTPGPDEFRQSAILKTIFKEQLRKASAVTLVVDYTKMNSESDAEVKEQIEDVANLIGKKHLFVLLNKFDERKHNRKDEDIYNEAKKLISEGILKNKIEANNVYPVSSKSAFYANLGFCEIERKGEIDSSLSWAEDFGVEVIGRSWRRKIDDKNEVLECCREVWKDSYLEKPLNNIIATIHSEALALALDAPLGKLANILQETSNGLKIRERSYSENIKKLKETIDALKNDINNMESISKNLSLEIEKSVAYTKEKLEENIGKSIDEIYDAFK
ncbi:MAG: dynamin family protein, partial [Bacteroidales bacterium]|nr:dynamin family protein [Bacteroidales bacterium]